MITVAAPACRAVLALILLVWLPPLQAASSGRGATPDLNCSSRFAMGQIEATFAAESDALVIGEVHGNAETPEAFYELVCATIVAKRRTLTVGLELSESAVSTARVALREGEGPADVRVRLGTRGFWPEARDGRSSGAHFDLLSRLFVLEDAGRLKVVGFDRRGIEARDFGDAAADHLDALAKRQIRTAAPTRLHAARAASHQRPPTRWLSHAFRLLPRKCEPVGTGCRMATLASRL